MQAKLACSMRPAGDRASTSGQGFMNIAINSVKIIKDIDELEYQISDSDRDPVIWNEMGGWGLVTDRPLPVPSCSPICS